MSNSKENQTTTVAKCSQRITALATYATKGKISVHGTSVTEAEAQATYQACLDTRQQLTSLRGQVSAALAARKAADAAMASFDAGMRDWVAATYGPTSQAAVDFGFAKKTPAKPRVAEKAAAAAKAVATRNARGVTGSKKRKAITAPAQAATPTAK